ncbi:ATP synthase subunit g, mitochondrial, partial [Fragariocoptes setiger]
MASMANKLAGAVQALRPVVAKAADRFIYYGKVELVPPTPAELPEAFRGLKKLITDAKSGAWRNTTMREAWRNTLITTEVVCWFFVGEVIGKGTLIGYQV